MPVVSGNGRYAAVGELFVLYESIAGRASLYGDYRGDGGGGSGSIYSLDPTAFYNPCVSARAAEER